MHTTVRRVTAARTSVAIVACLVVLPLVLAACGSKASGNATPTPTPSTSADAAAAQVKANWQTFFAGTTSADKKIALVQGAQQFAAVIRAQAASPLAKATQASVTSVKLVSPTKAEVKYAITQGGQPVLPNQTGVAVLQGGVWKVSAASFSALLALEGKMLTSPSATP